MAWTDTALTGGAIVGLLVVAVLLFLPLHVARRKKKRAAQRAFPDQVALLLRRRGYTLAVNRVAGTAVSHIAKKDGKRIGLLIAQPRQRITPRVIDRLVADAAWLGCRQTMIITNRGFNEHTWQVAQARHCTLLDSYALDRWQARQSLVVQDKVA